MRVCPLNLGFFLRNAARVLLPRVQGLLYTVLECVPPGIASKDLISVQTWVQSGAAPEGARQDGGILRASHSVRGHTASPPAWSTKQMWLKISFHRRGEKCYFSQETDTLI